MSRPIRRRTILSTAAVPLLAAAVNALPGRALANVYDDDGVLSGLVFTSSNDASGNSLLVYARDARGDLSLWRALPTGGLGSGAGLGSQGAVTLSRNGRSLYVVNAGSNTLSTFRLAGRDIVLASVVDSGGLHPISVTEHNRLVVVLNDGGAGNVAALRESNGTLLPLPSSSRPLSTAGGSAPAQVSFGSDGRVLIVTEKATNRLVSWPVAPNDSLGLPTVSVVPGQTPFGFAVTTNNRIIVSEAWGGAAGASTVSSWRVDPSGRPLPRVVSPAVANGQGASCWVVTTPDGRYAYVSNTGSANLSRYDVGADGSLTLADAIAASTGAGSAPADSAIASNGHRLYVRNGRTFTIAAYAIDGDGDLGTARFVGGLPATAVGLAAN
jgi:6-phosphogluconolactonase (cycloisomerase 2 family)